MLSRKNIPLLAMALGCLVSWGTASAVIMWSVPSGSTTNYDYDGGLTFNGLFVGPGMSPTVSPTGLVFFPQNFIAEAQDGSAETTDDTLEFALHVKPGKALTQFIVHEFGDYTILGAGPNTAVKAFGGLYLVNLDDGNALPLFDTLVTVPVGLSTVNGVTSGQGAWTGGETLINIPQGWTNIQVILNNELQAGSDPGTTSFIQKKVGQIGLEIILVIPEPGTLSLCLIGGAMLLSRRSRRIAA